MKEHRKTQRRNEADTQLTDLESLKRDLEDGTADEAHDCLMRAMASISPADLDATMTSSAAIPSAASARGPVRVAAWLTKSTRRGAAELLGVSESHVSRNEAIDRAMLDRLQALAYLFARVSRVIGLSGAALWFKDPNPGLDGKAPVALFDTSYGRAKVNDLVTALLHGDII